MIHPCKKRDIDARLYNTCIFNSSLGGEYQNTWGKDSPWLKYLRTTRARLPSPSSTSAPSASALPGIISGSCSLRRAYDGAKVVTRCAHALELPHFMVTPRCGRRYRAEYPAGTSRH